MAALTEKFKLLKGLLGDGKAYAGPFYAVVDPTRRCNLNCPGCIYHSSEAIVKNSTNNRKTLDIPVDLFERVCKELATMGTKSIVLTGEGEPFLHPNLFDLIYIAKHAGMRVKLLTNGTFLGKDQIEALIDSRLDILKITLWGSSKSAYAQNYPGSNPENFDKIIKGLSDLFTLKAKRSSMIPSVVLHQPVNRNNFLEIEGMVDIANQTHCDKLTFAPFKTRQGKLAHLSLKSNELMFVQTVLPQMARNLANLGIKHNINLITLRYRIGANVWQKLPCYIGYVHLRIKMNGDVFPCNPCNILLGNMYQNSLMEIWNGAPMQKFRKKTRSRKGLMEVGRHCDCEYCCLLGDNWRMHRIFRWLSPIQSVI